MFCTETLKRQCKQTKTQNKHEKTQKRQGKPQKNKNLKNPDLRRSEEIRSGFFRFLFFLGLPCLFLVFFCFFVFFWVYIVFLRFLCKTLFFYSVLCKSLRQAAWLYCFNMYVSPCIVLICMYLPVLFQYVCLSLYLFLYVGLQGPLYTLKQYIFQNKIVFICRAPGPLLCIKQNIFHI